MFHDRLICVEDRSYFLHLMSGVCQKYFQTPVLDLPDEAVIEQPPILLFGDFMNPAQPKENRVYGEINDLDKLKVVLKVRSLLMFLRIMYLHTLCVWYVSNVN